MGVTQQCSSSTYYRDLVRIRCEWTQGLCSGAYMKTSWNRSQCYMIKFFHKNPTKLGRIWWNCIEIALNVASCYTDSSTHTHTQIGLGPMHFTDASSFCPNVLFQVSSVFFPGKFQGFALVNRQRTNRISSGFTVEVSSDFTQLSYSNFDYLGQEPHYWQLPGAYQGDKVSNERSSQSPSWCQKPVDRLLFCRCLPSFFSSWFLSFLLRALFVSSPFTLSRKSLSLLAQDEENRYRAVSVQCCLACGIFNLLNAR